jgi:dipeptidyl-peptidase-4
VDTSDLYVKDRRILSIEAATGNATTLYREQEPDNVTAYWQAGWAPDGGIYFVSDRDDFYHLYYLAPDETLPVAMTAGDWAVERFASTPAGLYVVANAPHPSERQIFRIDGPGVDPVRLSAAAGTHSPTYSPDGRSAAVIFSSDAQPPDLFFNTLTGEEDRQVTRSRRVVITDSRLRAGVEGPPDSVPFDEYEWITPEYVTFPSHVDGVEIHGRLLLPPGFDPARQYPAIIGSIYSGALRNQWGGRNAHPVWGLDQILLQQGYVVLNIDIRGSWGHGRDFRRKLKQDYGGVDTEDIYSGVKYLIGTGYVDAKRIGLWGSSYGGLMTAMSLFTRPGVFAAGVAGAPATNVWHALTGEMRVMGRPQDNPEDYADSSAFTHAAGLEDPLMIIHGMRDRIVLVKDSLQLVENLMLLGKADLVDLVLLPNSRHGWDAAELYQTRFAFKKLIGHFNRYLKPGH